ncbi:MAG: peptidase S41 protein [Sphingobacteriales bacterium]|nr:MAG: peptidase S41 protein [Sphingobacteriales bacterium]
MQAPTRRLILPSMNSFRCSGRSTQRIVLQRIVFKGDHRYSLAAEIPPKERFSSQWKKKYDSKPGFEVRLIDGKYGYILIPKIMLPSINPEMVHEVAQPLYDQVAALQDRYHPHDWILDPRFNTGENAWPMLASVYHLLGNTLLWSSLNSGLKPVDAFSFDNGVYRMGSKKQFSINPKGPLMVTEKVAVITGLLTTSSGEVTALAFKGRPNTLFIGEPTLGYTTGNRLVKLPFGYEMALTTSYNGDRKGSYHKRIVPDIPVAAQDQFDDLMEDKISGRRSGFSTRPLQRPPQNETDSLKPAKAALGSLLPERHCCRLAFAGLLSLHHDFPY